jgi:hypothetical protein
MNYQFRLIDSELTGASIDIKLDKTYRVGNQMDFDIFIPFENVDSLQSFDFVVYDDRVTFSNLSSPIIKTDPHTFHPSQVEAKTYDELPALFEFMNIKFALCDAEDSWETWQQISQSEPVPEAPPQEANEPPQETEQMNAPQPDNTNKTSILDRLLAAVEDTKIVPDYLKSKRMILFLCLLPFLILGGIIGFRYVQAYFAYQNLSNEKTASALTNIQEIKQIQVNLPSEYANLKFITNQSDLVVIMGIVKDQKDIDYLKEKFAKFEKLIEFKVLTASQALNQLNNILKTRNLNLINAYFDATTYRMRIVGFLDNLDVINDVEIDISLHLPQLSDLDTSMIYAVSAVNNEFDEIFARNKVANRLRITKNYDSKVFTVEGYLTASDIETLKRDCADFVTRYHNLIDVKLNIKDAFQALPFKIVSVSTSGLPSFMTEQGQKIFEGTEIEGIRVDKITSTQIVFSGKFSLVLKLDDALDNTTNGPTPAKK